MTVALRRWPVLATAALLAAIVAVALLPYRGNVTALFHLDDVLASRHEMPEGFVVLQVPAYDGAQYYQMARNMPLIFSGDWEPLRELPPGSYAYQRFLLPLVAWIVAFGQEPLLPYAFLLINVLALIATAAVALKSSKGKGLYALAFAFCPSAMVALHFMLAEPLALLAIALFLQRYVKQERIGWVEVLLLTLLALSREVNILFIALLFVYVVGRKRWKDVALMLIPIAGFLALHGLIYAIFKEIPFLESADKRTFPLQAIWELLTGVYGYNRLTLSSIPLFLFFVLPGFVWTVRHIAKRRDFTFLPLATLAFLGLMLTMPDHIWGSITSIGRVITPVYPLFLTLAAKEDTWPARLISAGVLLLGLAAAFGLALLPHPFILA